MQERLLLAGVEQPGPGRFLRIRKSRAYDRACPQQPRLLHQGPTTFSTRLSAGGAVVAGLLVLSQLPVLESRPVVRTSILGTALALLAWSALLFGVLRRGQKVTLEVMPRRQHYLQACQQGLVLLFWGYYWREVYHAVPLIVAQLLFAYAFDSSAVYYAATGIFFFSDLHVPIAVFLGMHLLFTDPATSPRTELGRIIYGVLYGLTTILLYDWLLRLGLPGFYDKLLQVPLLNLSVKLLDGLARSPLVQRINPSE